MHKDNAVPEKHQALLALTAAGLLAAAIVSAQQAGPQGPPRDTPAQRTPAAPAPTGGISGRVVAADLGRPLSRTRVLINTPEIPSGRATTTNDEGVYYFAELPAGRYSINASKPGFITLSYGQRRPLQAGTPVQLAEGQQLSGIDFSLPRGSAIAGHIYDETGEPLPSVAVRVMRYQYAQGNRQLVATGNAQSDDQGYYRVWGLNPGEYYVSAMVRNFDMRGRGLQVPMGPGGRGVGFAGRGGRGGAFPGGLIDAIGSALAGSQDAAADVAYAPTFYPGTPSIAAAQAVSVGLGAEALNIDFRVVQVRTARVTGRVTRATGVAATSGNVLLRADTGQGGRGGPGPGFGALVQGDSSFSIAGVPPGSYVLHFRDNPDGIAQFAIESVTLADGEARDVHLVLVPGGSIEGTVSLDATEPTGTTNVTQGRVATQPVDGPNFGPNTFARLERDGTFAIDGVSPGHHWIRWQGGARGWTLQSISMAGRDITDTPIEIRSGQRVTGISLVLTDRLSEVNGTVSDNAGVPITELTVLAFPGDSTLWRPQSRHIMTARPDQNGKYQIRGLPPGEYYLATIDPAEQGEWFEPSFLEQHRTAAVRVRLGERDVSTQDFTLGAR